MTLRSMIVFALAAVLGPGAAWAQDQSATWRSFAEKLPPGSLVLVQLTTGRSIEGHIIEVTADTLKILPRTRIAVPARDVRFADVQSIRPRKETMSPGAKVLIGVGAAGGVLLLIFVALLSSLD